MANAIPPSSSGELALWEINLAAVLVSVFLFEQDVFTRDDRDDLVNECLLHWLQVRNRYNAERGAAVQTYMRHVLRNKLSDLLEAETAAKRGGYGKPLSLSTLLDSSDAESDTWADVVPDKSMAGDTEAAARHLILQELLQVLRANLSPQDQDLFDLLLRDSNKAAAMRELRLSRGTLYRRLEPILKLAKEQGLAEFLD